MFRILSCSHVNNLTGMVLYSVYSVIITSKYIDVISWLPVLEIKEDLLTACIAPKLAISHSSAAS